MRRILTVVLILAVSGVCASLGFWQLGRLGQRRQENAVVMARSAMPELVVTGLETEGLVEFRAVTAEGLFDFDHQLVRVGRPMDGIPGVTIITPLVLGDGSAILVERGWAPSPDARRVDLAPLDEGESARVRGIVLAPSDAIYPINDDWPLFVRSVNIDGLAGRFPYGLLPWVLRRTDPPNTEEGQVFRTVRTQPPSNGPHLSYAFQWFSFAAIALVGGYFLVLRPRRESEARPKTALT